MKRIITTSIILLAAVSIMAATGRKQQYFPDGRDIVCQDGDKRYNRALYGSYTEYRLETSDRYPFPPDGKRQDYAAGTDYPC